MPVGISFFFWEREGGVVESDSGGGFGLDL